MNNMICLSFVEPARAKWQLTIGCAKKKGCSLCLRTDYQNPNAVTARHAYLILLIYEWLHLLADGAYSRHWHHFLVLSKQDRRLSQRQNDDYTAPWTVQSSTIARQWEKCAKQVAAHEGHYIVKDLEFVCNCLSGWFHQLRKVCQRSSGSSTDCTMTNLEIRCIVETEQMLHLQGLHRLFGLHNTAWQT